MSRLAQLEDVFVTLKDVRRREVVRDAVRNSPGTALLSASTRESNGKTEGIVVEGSVRLVVEG